MLVFSSANISLKSLTLNNRKLHLKKYLHDIVCISLCAEPHVWITKHIPTLFQEYQEAQLLQNSLFLGLSEHQNPYHALVSWVSNPLDKIAINSLA